MSLSAIGIAIILTFTVLVISGRISALVGLITVPVLFAVAGGFGAEIGTYAMDGIRKVGPGIAVATFALLYFAVMFEGGLFDPLILFVVRMCGHDPLRISIGTLILAMGVSFDGNGMSTVLITVTTMLPIYRRIGMNVLLIPTLVLLPTMMTNLLPWGGPALLASTALNVDIARISGPLLPTLAAGLLFSFFVAWWLGMRERRRVGKYEPSMVDAARTQTPAPKATAGRLRFWGNLALTAVLFIIIGMAHLPLPIAFSLAFAIALLFNFPSVKAQKHVLQEHAGNVVTVVTLLLGAGIFTGVLEGSGMLNAISADALKILPQNAGPHMGLLTALVAGPLEFLLPNGPYYFGILPVLAKTAAEYGLTHEQIARAALLGQALHGLSPLVPAAFLMAGLVDRDPGEIQRFALGWAILLTAVIIVAAIVSGAVPFHA